MAAGAYLDESGVSHIMGEQLSSGLWTSATLPAVAGSLDQYMSGVSCPSPAWCLATGDYLDASGTTLVESDVLSGDSWTASTIPVPGAGGHGDVTPPSCSGPGSCVVILDQAPPVAASLSGGTWSFAPLPMPAGAWPQAYISGLSCPSTAWCMAVGTYNDSTGSHLMSETLSDDTWTVATIPPPPDAPGPTLNAVKCVAIGSCVAVGRSADDISNIWQPIVETLSGGSWTGSTLPLPRRATNESLTAVDCVSVASCNAAGIYTDVNGNEKAFSDLLANGTWTPTVLSNPSTDQESALTSESCPPGGNCEAVGVTFGWDGGTHPAAAALPALP